MASEGQYFGGNVSLLGKLGVGTLTPTEKIDVVGGDISLDDSSKLKLGAGDDLQIYHDGTNSYIDNSSTYLILEGDNIILRNNAGNEDYAKFFGDGACELYFNNSKKFETTNTGGTLTGKLVVSGDLDVDGTTTTFNSTVMTVDDPVFGIGGDTAPGSSDNKDRGVSFRYFLSGGSAKVGFFGFDTSANAFTFLTDTNDDSTEVFSGTVGNLNVGTVLHGDGSAGAPSISFSSDTNTGIFRADADKLGFSVGGSEKMRLTSSGLGVGTTSPNF